MANAIDKLVISLGFDSVELNEGLRKASGAIADFGKRVELDGRALDRLAATASKTGLMMGGVSDEVAERVMSIGTAGQKTSLVMGRAMDGISARVGKVGALLKTALGPVLAVFAGGKIFSGLSQMGESLDVLSERTGVAVDKIDAWAKANRDAGGSEEAFKSALENWTVEKGRSADDFFRMGEAVKGMSQQQAAYFMRAMGLSQDAAAVFTKFTDKASSAAKAYEGMAMTSEQAKAAREMNIRWRQFTDQAQALGNVLGVTVLPVVNRVLKVLGDGVAFLREHSKGVKLILAGLGAVLAVTYGRSIIQAIATTSTFFKTLKAGQGVMAALNATMLANPVAALVAGVLALCLALDDLLAFLDGGNSLLGKFLSFIGFSDKQIDAFRKSLLNFLQVLGGIPEKIVGAIQSAWDGVKDFGKWVGGLFDGVDFSGVGKALSVGILLPLKVIGKGIVAVFDGLEVFFTDLPTKIAKSIPKALSSLSGLSDEVGAAFIRAFHSAIDWAKKAFKALVGLIGKWVANALNIGDKVKGVVSGAVDSVTDGVKNAMGGIADILGFDAKGKPKEASAPAQDPSGKPAPDGGAADGIKDRVKGVFGGIASFFRGGDEAKAPAADAWDWGRYASAPTQAAAGAIAASQAKTSQAPAVANQMEMNVVNNIQTNGSPEDVGKAVGGAMDNALSRRNRMLVAAQSGVISK